MHGTGQLLTLPELVERMNNIITDRVQRDFKEFDEIALMAMNNMLESLERRTKVEVFDSKLISRNATNATLGDMSVAAAIEKFN